MKRDEQDQLLNEIISGEEIGEFRRSSLTQGLGAMQRRNRRRRAVRTGAMLVVPALLALALFFGRRPDAIVTSAPLNTDQVRNATPRPATEVATAPIKVINDEELLALFPERSLALLGPPGQQQLVFLDKAKKPEIHRPL